MPPFRSAAPMVAGFTALIAMAWLHLAGPAQASGAEEALALLSGPVAGDKTLERMIGLWKGNGTLRQSPDAREEAVRCRLTNQWAEGQTLLKMQLACIGNDYRFTATGHVGIAGETYRGSWSTTRGDTAQATGRRSGSGLSLSFQGTDLVGRPQRSSLSIAIDGRTMTNQFVRTDRESGVRYGALAVTLRK